MKISMYTFLFEIDSKFYAYNTLSNALIEIAEDTYKILLVNKNRHTPLQEKDLGCDELYQTLIENHMITENDRDEFLLYKSIILAGRSINILNLTIAPTMDCNYSCSYCFENCKRSVYMTEEVISSIIKFLKNNETTKNVHVTWFGGEPLMGINQIRSLYSQMIQLSDKRYSFSMITNGFLMSLNIIEFLKEMKLRHIQITLDGLKENHNKVKYTSNCADTFTRTIKNIDLLVSSAPDIRVDIRVNMNKENADEFAELYAFITERYKTNPQIGIYPAFVTASSSESTLNSVLFSRKEKSRFLQNLYYDTNILTYPCRYPDSSFMECSIRNTKTFTIDPEGYLYKCWEIIGDRKYAIGKFNKNGDVEITNQVIDNRYLYGADPLEDKTCSQCSYLPICFGGCPHKRIENEFKHEYHDTCTHLKGSLKEFIKIHLLSKTDSAFI